MMDRSRPRKLATRVFVCALLSGALVTGYGVPSQANHGECGLQPTPSRQSDEEYREFGVRAEYGQAQGRPYVGVFGHGNFVVADGDQTGAKVYGSVDIPHDSVGDLWFRADVDPQGNGGPDGDQYADVCSRSH